jgi:hypothetical protein
MEKIAQEVYPEEFLLKQMQGPERTSHTRVSIQR